MKIYGVLSHLYPLCTESILSGAGTIACAVEPPLALALGGLVPHVAEWATVETIPKQV